MTARSTHEIETLLVLGSSLTALAVVRCAAATGLKCVVLDTIEGPALRTRHARFRRLASETMAAVESAALDLLGRPDVAVVADSDRWLRFVLHHRDAQTDNGWLVLHPSASALEICLDKSAFLDWCAQHRLRAPRRYDHRSILQGLQVPFPLMIRPEFTQHSVPTGLPKAVEVRETAALQHWLGRFRDAGVIPSICDSLLRDGLRQFSVGAARDSVGDVRTFLAEKVRPDAAACAGGTYVRPASHAGIEELAVEALEALDYFGVAEVEILYDPADACAYLVEVNARPWLQHGLPFACGCDLLAHALGREPSVPARPSKEHAWLFFASDVYACFSRTTGMVTRGEVGALDYIRSMLLADNFAVWDWRDPGPLLDSSLRSLARMVRQWVGHQSDRQDART